MPKRVENLTNRPVLFALASGDPIRLSPGAVSATLADVEVAGSRKVDELVARGVIAVHDHDAAEDEEQPVAAPPDSAQAGAPSDVGDESSARGRTGSRRGGIRPPGT